MSPLSLFNTTTLVGLIVFVVLAVIMGVVFFRSVVSPELKEKIMSGQVAYGQGTSQSDSIATPPAVPTDPPLAAFTRNLVPGLIFTAILIYTNRLWVTFPHMSVSGKRLTILALGLMVLSTALGPMLSAFVRQNPSSKLLRMSNLLIPLFLFLIFIGAFICLVVATGTVS
ncbi:MAG: hypothetical protein WA001_02575 [Patescibacteria group bacterium]